MVKDEDEDFHLDQKWNMSELKELKRERIMDKRLNDILREIAIYTIFLFVLYYVSFVNISSISINYNELFQNTFVHQQDQNKIGLTDVIKRKNSYIAITSPFN